MAKSRVIYNVEGLFAGPAPASGYHFIDSDGNLHNNPSAAGSRNLINPLHRVTSISYDFNAERTEIKALGKKGALARPILTPPTVNISFDYHQFGITNEARLGFYTNFAKTPYSIYEGQPFYADNFSVFLLSGFTTTSYERSEHSLGWPLAYRDKRNLYLAIAQDNNDLNEQTETFNRNVDVVGFGNCYLTSYKASAAVGDTARVSVNYLAENMRFYSSGSGATTPALNYHDGTEVSGVQFVIPSLFESGMLNSPSAILPGDITVDIVSYPDYTGRRVADGTPLFQQYTGRGNLVPWSEDFDVWFKSGGDGVGDTFVDWDVYKTWFDAAYYSADKILITGSTTFASVASPSFWLQSGISYEIGAWIKSGNVATSDLGIWDWNLSGWIARGEFSLTGGENGWSTQNFGSELGVRNLPSDWKYIYMITEPMDEDKYARVDLFPGYSPLQQSGDYIYAYASQVKDVEWPEGYVRTFATPITGIPQTRSIKNIGMDFRDLRIESYDISLNLRRENQVSLTHKLPSDRKVLFPIYADLNFSIIYSENETGSIAELIRQDENFDITLKLENPLGLAQTGYAVRYDFIGAKFNGVDYQSSIGENKSANLSFTVELDPDDMTKGMFMSGLFNIEREESGGVFGGYYQIDGGDDDGSYILQENGSKIKTEDYSSTPI